MILLILFMIFRPRSDVKLCTLKFFIFLYICRVVVIFDYFKLVATITFVGTEPLMNFKFFTHRQVDGVSSGVEDNLLFFSFKIEFLIGV
jgi:hypothetical protein